MKAEDLCDASHAATASVEHMCRAAVPFSVVTLSEMGVVDVYNYTSVGRYIMPHCCTHKKGAIESLKTKTDFYTI